jgi:hypothetical protein
MRACHHLYSLDNLIQYELTLYSEILFIRVSLERQRLGYVRLSASSERVIRELFTIVAYGLGYDGHSSAAIARS